MFQEQMSLSAQRLGLLAAALCGGALALLIAGVPGFAQGEDGEQQAAPPLERWVPLYSNPLRTRADQSELTFYRGQRRCARRMDNRRLRMIVRPPTRICAWRTPVLGHRTDIAATFAISNRTPRNVLSRTAAAVTVRGGQGGSYRLEVIPNRRFWRVVKEVPTADGTELQVLAQGSERSIRGTGARNRLRLRVDGGNLAAWVGSTKVAQLVDPQPNLPGRAVAVGLYGDRSIRGAEGLVSGIRVQVPNPL